MLKCVHAGTTRNPNTSETGAFGRIVHYTTSPNWNLQQKRGTCVWEKEDIDWIQLERRGWHYQADALVLSFSWMTPARTLRDIDGGC